MYMKFLNYKQTKKIFMKNYIGKVLQSHNCRYFEGKVFYFNSSLILAHSSKSCCF